MLRYERISRLPEANFRRLTGILRATFDRMVEILKAHLRAQTAGHKHRGGRKPVLCPEDMILMALEYLREYRTLFHIATGYGVGESTAHRTIRTVEDVLIKSGAFSLPGRKALLERSGKQRLVVLDATETPIERPKKNSGSSTQERRRGTQSSKSWSSTRKATLSSVREAKDARAAGTISDICSTPRSDSLRESSPWPTPDTKDCRSDAKTPSFPRKSLKGENSPSRKSVTIECSPPPVSSSKTSSLGSSVLKFSPNATETEENASDSALTSSQDCLILKQNVKI